MPSYHPQPDIIRGRDIVITGQQPWDVGIGSNCKDIALEFSKHNRVLYVNSPLDRITSYRGRNNPLVTKRKEIINSQQKSIEQVGDNLWVLNPMYMLESVNWIGNQAIFEIFTKLNNKRFAKSISLAIKTLGLKNIILFNDNDMFRSFHLKELLNPAVSIYYSRDYMLAVDYWKKHGTKMEPELIAKSDICVANSTYLASYCRQYNPNSYYVGQGCDLSNFTKGIGSQPPADIKDIPGPIIGYVGALQSIRLDIALIEYMAATKPDWSIVLVGPEDEQFKQSALHQMKNVYFLGSKDVSQIPQYVNVFDVCINPQVVNQVTIGNYPRKIDEYLAMGKPVLATVTDAMSVFAAYTYLGTTKEDYVRLAQQALDEDNRSLQQARMAFAATHSWENSVGGIYKAINALKNENGHARATALPKNLVILGMPRHDDDLESTSFMLSKELANHFKVYYIDNPFTYRDYMRSKGTPKFEKRKALFATGSDGILDIGIQNLKVIITPVLSSIHFLPEGWIYRQFLKRNEAVIRKRIQKALRKEGVQDYIYLNSFNFHYPDVANGLNPALTVYHSLDPLIMDFDKKHGAVSEPLIVKESDLVICSAKSLFELYKHINPNTHFLPNAADIKHSGKALDAALPVYPYISSLKGPVVGYFGNVERRIDYKLMESVAKKLPGVNFVLTGPYDEVYIPASFRELPNVHLTGKVPYADMPSVVKGFDVAIIPFKVDEASSSIFPLKLFEYLGAGKPVIATPFNQDLANFTGHLVQYKNTAESFAEAIEYELKTGNDMKAERIALASANTWEHRATQLINLMKEQLGKK